MPTIAAPEARSRNYRQSWICKHRFSFRRRIIVIITIIFVIIAGAESRLSGMFMVMVNMLNVILFEFVFMFHMTPRLIGVLMNGLTLETGKNQPIPSPSAIKLILAASCMRSLGRKRGLYNFIRIQSKIRILDRMLAPLFEFFAHLSLRASR